MMRRDPVYYFIVQSVRLLLLPFPLTVFVCASEMAILKVYGPWNWDQYVVGVISGMACSEAPQVVVGLPSLLALDRFRSGARGYLATGGGIALVVSFLLGWIFAEDFGESRGRMVCWSLLFVGPPIVMSYLLAFVLRKRMEESAQG